MMPTLRRSLVAPLRLAVIVPLSLVTALQSGPGKVCRQNLLRGLAGPGPSDRTPLTEPDPVPCPHPVDHQASHPIVSHRSDQIERRALQWLARAGTHYLSDRRAIDFDLRPAQPNGELVHPT